MQDERLRDGPLLAWSKPELLQAKKMRGCRSVMRYCTGSFLPAGVSSLDTRVQNRDVAIWTWLAMGQNGIPLR